MGLGRTLSRAAGQLTYGAVTGRSFIGETPDTTNRQRRDRVGSEGRDAILRRIGGGGSTTEQRQLRDSMTPSYLLAGGRQFQQQQQAWQVGDSTINQTINVESGADPELIADAVARETRSAQERTTREIQAALVPQSVWEE